MKETDFTRMVCQNWIKRGWTVVVNQAGHTVANIPDRDLICPLGTIYLEFKGQRTKIRTGQKVWMDRANRSLAMSAIVLRYHPDGAILQHPDGTVIVHTHLDPHTNPEDALSLAQLIFSLQRKARA